MKHYFGNNDQRMGAVEDALPKMPPLNGETLPPVHGNAGSITALILQNMILVSKGTLDDGALSFMETV